ncbi:MAG: ParM/StbA family protein [Bacillota bacterium]|nr:ParM/StbA family protein [Bacillota bacterium]
MMIVGIDGGNNEVDVASSLGLDHFVSQIGEFRERKMKDIHGKDDMVFEYQGRRGFAGTLALAESEFSGSIMGDSKAHEDAKLRILIALHRQCMMENEFKIVVGQPISKHTDEEKNRIKNMLIGSHDLIINGKRKIFTIQAVEVAAEGGAAFWAKPKDGLVRIIDVGSGTVNCASLRDKRYIDKDSFTLPFGMNTVKTNNLSEMSRGIVTQTSKKWNKEDFVWVLGGAAEILIPYIQKYYPNAMVMHPIFQALEAHPVFANSIGFYKIGTAIYG